MLVMPAKAGIQYSRRFALISAHTTRIGAYWIVRFRGR
jgi:hypothetical protein